MPKVTDGRKNNVTLGDKAHEALATELDRLKNLVVEQDDEIYELTAVVNDLQDTHVGQQRLIKEYQKHEKSMKKKLLEADKQILDLKDVIKDYQEIIDRLEEDLALIRRILRAE